MCQGKRLLALCAVLVCFAATGSDDLAALRPENHRNLIVKVCGFSARFIALSPKWQDEVIARHRLK